MVKKPRSTLPRVSPVSWRENTHTHTHTHTKIQIQTGTTTHQPSLTTQMHTHTNTHTQPHTHTHTKKENSRKATVSYLSSQTNCAVKRLRRLGEAVFSGRRLGSLNLLAEINLSGRVEGGLIYGRWGCGG